jgi:hypothetical protein
MNELLDHMLSQSIITDDMYDQISVQSTKKEQITEFLLILPRRGPQAFDKFLEALNETSQDFIAERLIQTYNQELARSQQRPMQGEA